MKCFKFQNKNSAPPVTEQMTAPGTTQGKMAVIGQKAKEFGKEAKVIGKKLGSEG